MKIALTGGHLTTALAVIDELEKTQAELIFLGRATATEGDKAPSAESVIVPGLGIKFYPIKVGRLQRRFSLYTIPSIARVPAGFVQSLIILGKERPDAIVSFGSYVAFPVVLAGWVLGIPTITHEQTVKAGLANRLISFFAKKVAVAWKESLEYFPKDKSVLVGNPVRAELLNLKKVRTSRPAVLITGGNQGSHVINEAVTDILADLLKNYEVIHQTGGSEVYKDFEKLKAASRLLPKKLSSRYKIAKWFNTKELIEIFSRVDVLVGRAGANTVSEAAALGIPAVFIPIPWATGDEQTENAKILESMGAAVILPQDRLTPKRLLNSIDYIIKNYRDFKSKARGARRLVDNKAAANFAQEIEALVSSNV